MTPIFTQRKKPLILVLFVVMVFAGMMAFCLMAHAWPALADDEADAQVSAAQQQVEQSSASYDEAQASLEQIEAEITANEQRIQELSSKIPVQQEKSNAAIRALYKMQQDSGSLLMLLFSADSFNDLLVNIDYLYTFYESKMAEINSLVDMKTELDTTASNLANKQAQAQEETAAAQKALEQAQQLREEAQAAADAARAAEEEAAAAAEEAARIEAEEEEVHESASGGELSEGDISSSPSDNVDWSLEKNEFVSEWASRIDAYLSGSPLSGQGETFAAAAWDYGIDPRFSPAISCVESTKGTYCFKSHNAWGWGSSSWDTWEEAIYAHVRGLSRGYGYTVTVEGAQKYCPPNWEFWYSRVCAEMEKI